MPRPHRRSSAQLTPQISVVLPTFNEAGNIGPLIDRTLAALGGEGPPLELVVVDDDSPDGTAEVVAGRAAADGRVRLVQRRGEKGLTSAICRGIAEARGRWIGWMDCDLSMPPEEWPRLRAALAAGADLAIASRYVAGGQDAGHDLRGRFFSRLINLAAALALDPTIGDYTSGYVLARRQVLRQVPLRGDYGEYCIDLLCRARRAGFRVEEVPYRCVPRQSGESKTATSSLGYLRRGARYVATIARLRLAR